jgi:AcrR family transcriptional regulator
MGTPDPGEDGGERRRRSDALANERRILEAATAAIKREGIKVPIATIAADASVGVGTVYRHFPDREDLLAALAERSYGLVLEHAKAAAASPATALASVDAFLRATIAHRADLILPLHGGPVTLDERSAQLRAEISEHLERVLRRGQEDGTIRGDVTGVDIIVFGATLAQPLPHVPDWDHVAARQAQIFLAGLGVHDATPLPGRGLTRAQLESSFANATER